LANNWERVPRSGRFLKALDQGSLAVTPEQRKKMRRADVKDRNNRLVTDGPAVALWDSNALCIPQVCRIKK